ESGQGELGWLARHAAHPRERPARCAGPDRAAALTERKAIPGRQGVASVRSLDVALLPYCIQFPSIGRRTFFVSRSGENGRSWTSRSGLRSGLTEPGSSPAPE